MQRKILIGGLAAMALAATGGVAVARQQTARQADISRADFVARQVQRLDAADADRDGQITARERLANREAKRTERRGDAFDRLDADRDGELSREEFQARSMRPAPAERMNRPTVSVAESQARAEQRYDRLDVDRDGVLTVEERRAGRQHAREARRERRLERRASPRTSGSE